MLQRLAVVLTAACAVAACGGDGGFESRDPNGFAACRTLAEGREAEGAGNKIGAVLQAAGHAGRSSTQSIEDTVEVVVPGTDPLVDVKALVAACEEQGYDMPVFVD